MKHIQSFFLIVVAALMLTACEEVMEFDIEEGERAIVVNALPCADSTLFVNVTYSRFFLDNTAFQPVAGADVKMEINGTMTPYTSYQDGNYYFAHTLAGGDTLTVHVGIEGRDEIVGGTRMPYIPALLNFKAEIDTTQPITAGELTFLLDDDAAQRNYYLIYISERDSGTSWNHWEEKWDTIDTVRNSYFSCLDLDITAPEVNCSEGFMGYFSSILFTDSIINGEQHEMLISLMIPKDTAEHPIQRDYTLVVQSLSEEAFQYRKSVAKANSMEQYFAEPAPHYTNLRGALGIMGGIAQRVIPLVFTYKEPEEE